MGRFVTGIAVGGFNSSVPMLISESVASEIRGSMVACNQLMITLGIFIGNCVVYGFKDGSAKKDYLIPLGLGYVFAFLLMLGLSIVKESPRHLVATGKIDEASRALGFAIRLPPDSKLVQHEVSLIVESHNHSQQLGTGSWKELWTGQPRYFYRVLCAIFILSFQQLAGSNYFFYYGTVLFKSIGTDDTYATSMIISGVNMACTVAGLFFIKWFSRRFILIAGAVIAFVAFIIFASLGGFALFPNGEDHPASKPIGRLMIFFCCLFIFAAAASWNVLGFAVVTEILPQRIRAKAVGVASIFFWIWCFSIGFFTPMIVGDIGYKYGYVFSGCLLAAIAFTYTCVHETKDITLEEIDDMYESGVSAIGSGKYIRDLKQRKAGAIEA